MQGWKKIFASADKYKLDLLKSQLLRNGIDAMIQPKASQKVFDLATNELFVKENQYDIASVLVLEQDED